MTSDFNDTAHHKDQSRPPSLSIDWDAYLPYLEDDDISDADKRALIETLWSIVTFFVDLGFEVRSPSKPCGQEQPNIPQRVADMVGSHHHQKNQ
ncbi:hypothetical protein JANAI62_35700 [Jannaschia pagri]|uniref:Uncharacterized protein n=1 Tax=Jannaschia pagri TaxID=2829797 RepID=A0ABQ4NRD8_9RHOB|nr:MULTISPECIES: hypothetical protein [unclassified Jannaschia]GIT93146.1 hypothetical protein JANAI61_36040 [Jannaschia sp. AI_61]GIT96947.1 hypothetical protein JANAI62_35700 [Jannaschia sp. AI_62]